MGNGKPSTCAAYLRLTDGAAVRRVLTLGHAGTNHITWRQRRTLCGGKVGVGKREGFAMFDPDRAQD